MVKLPPAVHLETHIYSRILTLYTSLENNFILNIIFIAAYEKYNVRVISGVVVNCKLIISKQNLKAHELCKSKRFFLFLFTVDKQVKINISQFRI